MIRPQRFISSSAWTAQSDKATLNCGSAAVTSLVVASEFHETGLSGEALARTIALVVFGRTPQHLRAQHRLLVTSPDSLELSCPLSKPSQTLGSQPMPSGPSASNPTLARSRIRARVAVSPVLHTGRPMDCVVVSSTCQ